MLEKVWNTISTYNLIEPGELVIVGLSGGPDSLALLHSLHLLSEKGKFSLHAAHLNHSFRGRQADEEAEWVRATAESWGIPCTVKKVDVPAIIKRTGLSPQDAGHQQRQEFFLSLLKEHKGQKIALGHHANDQAETIIMHLLSGAGAEGLQGIRPFNPPLIRPLLWISRREIEEYCRQNNLDPRHDPSNKENVYLRNKIRNQLIPWIEENINPSLVGTLQKAAAILQSEEDYWEGVISYFMQQNTKSTANTVRLKLSEFGNEPQAVQRRVVRRIWQQITGEQGPSFQYVEDICQLALKGQVGKRLELTQGLTVLREYQDLLFCLDYQEESASPLTPRSLIIPGDNELPEKGLVIRASLSKEKPSPERNKIYLPYSEGNLPQLVIRSRQGGDWLSPKGMKGRKKLKKFLIDSKIPRNQRDGLLLLAEGDEVLWIPDLFVGERINSQETAEGYIVLDIIQNIKS